jgi:hypothetical protein
VTTRKPAARAKTHPPIKAPARKPIKKPLPTPAPLDAPQAAQAIPSPIPGGPSLQPRPKRKAPKKRAVKR